MAETTPLLSNEKMEDAPPHFPSTRRDARGRRLPQAIAHRGYKAAYPENTMGAFRGAVEVGAHAIETDLHITKDGIIVLSHDANLKRCFGKEDKVIDCDWSYLKTLRTLKEPHEPMPRFVDLLEYLASPGLEDIWVLLDIKLDNNPEDIIRLIGSTLKQVTPSKSWKKRIVLGCWAAKYLPLCETYLPGYQIAYIGFNIPYARQLLKIQGVHFNMHQQVLVGPGGATFIRDVKKAGRAIFDWTVNDEVWMKWSIRKEIDGVITDDPKKYLEVCKNYDGAELQVPLRLWGRAIWFNILAALFVVLFRAKFGFNIDAEKLQKSIKSVPAIEGEDAGVQEEI